jgi:glyceraldehyde 3-phosphate dehydrogenase
MADTKIRVAINGFGRIGRAFLKIAWEREDIEIVALNDLGTLESMAYLLKYDTVYRTWNKNIEVKDGNIVIDGKIVKVISEKHSCKRSNNLPTLKLNKN